jgi:hypothetical protein
VGAARAVGLADGQRLVALFVFVGVGILGPQLYLAARGEGQPFVRVRTGVLLSLLFLAGAYALTPPGERTLLVAAAVLLAATLVVSEGMRVGRLAGR